MTGADLAAVLLLGIAVHRAWRILAVDDLPWLVKARCWLVGQSAPIMPGGPYHVARPLLKEWLECPWCCGAWLSALAVLAYPDRPSSTAGLAFYWLAISSICGLIVRNLDPTED